MQIADERVVTLDYKLTDKDGRVIDESGGRGDFVYLHGARNIIPGLENALTGQKAGDTLEVTISPEEGYGERDERLLQPVPRSMFEGIDEVAPGMQFQAQGPDGQQHVVTVVSAEGDEVVIDGNHPLAGVELHFDVKVIDVRPATSEELEHGHAHAPGTPAH